MIRLTLLWIFITFIGMYAWRDWYKALCGLILLSAVLEHPDMPKTMLGIQGLNPWNILFGIIMMAWFFSAERKKQAWDMPDNIKKLLWVYLLLIFVAFFRMKSDAGPLHEWAEKFGSKGPSTLGMWSEYVINTIKWTLPGILLFIGCRDQSRFSWAIYSILALYFILGLQVIKWMPLSAIGSGEDLTERSLKILSREVGFHRVNLSMMLAGASWAIYSSRSMVKTKTRGFLTTLAASITFFAQALTGGRTGYATWGLIGIVLSVFRWRRLLLLGPVMLLILLMIIPAARDRMMQGFSEESRDTNLRIHGDSYIHTDGADLYTITAGRNIAWPYVIEKIGEAPFFGHGREAMKRTGTSFYLYDVMGESFPHPHNAYLQWLLDNGWVGFLPIIYLYYLFGRYSLSLFRDSRNPAFSAIGGITLSLILALLIASLGSQTFYPREGVIGMWCAIGLMLRVYVQRKNIITSIERDRKNGKDVETVEFTDERLWQTRA